MFETLLASAARRDRRAGAGHAAVGLHLLLLGTALTTARPAPVRPSDRARHHGVLPASDDSRVVRRLSQLPRHSSRDQ